MIDCVFLLLVYFMVTSSLEREEGLLGFQLPGDGAVAALAELPLEEWIEITAQRTVRINNRVWAVTESTARAELQAHLTQVRQLALSQQTELSALLVPEPTSRHADIIAVLDALAAAGIDTVSFAGQ
jgi:biopolymer transport protein ExbD